uniref:probable F-box protein At2g36090 isoform X1 n=1 Tax=Erigeron canadensis TaxID=72917 RepID=UPI001CB9D67F|nr:probable F-box protein At2g36090 isoform X1 [Erigeron canadensis]XP_043622367.1 probable F-box protein At2g36090 isoform X1 [Erigeron canadensis]
METLNNDLFYDILRRLDGATLASAACACAAFCAISKEERVWEDVCSSLWPSTKRDDVKRLILSIGGFKKFYADCFPLIVNKDVPEFRWKDYPEYSEEWAEAEFYGDYDELENVSPSDFVSIVDIKYKEKTICSKVIWGIPNANVYNGWFSDCPFRIDLFSYSARDDDHAGEVTLSVSDGLPPVTSIERERKEGKLWQELRDGIKLSWIIVNSKAKQAANLSSWCALDGQRHWPTNQDFLLHFGSIVPAKDILPYQVIKCIITMKFRVTHIEGSGSHTSLNLTELCMQLGDMEGAHVNGRNSLFVLKEALGCGRSKDYNLVLKSCQSYSKVQSEIKEEKIRHENRLDTLYIVGGITAFLWLCYYFCKMG